jgi:6-phosphogluconolactonase
MSSTAASTRSGGRLHHRRSMPELQHHRVRGRRQRNPHSAGDLLHPGHQPVPHHRRHIGNFLYVLDHDSPSSAACALALVPPQQLPAATSRHFQVNQTTGRLSLIVNAQVTAACPAPRCLGYFPVPANPIDFTWSPDTSSPSPELQPPATSSSPTPTTRPAAVDHQPEQRAAAHGHLPGHGHRQRHGIRLRPRQRRHRRSRNGRNQPDSPLLGWHQWSPSGADRRSDPDDATLANPIFCWSSPKASSSTWPTRGTTSQGTNSTSGLAGYVIDPTTHQLSFIAGEPFGSGSGPQCLVEDPSDQFIYSADFNDSSVTGRVVDPNSGVLNNLRVTSTFALQGPAAWCLIDGRTS